MLVVERQVLDATFTMLRTCGEGRDECVAYWTGPIDEPDLVDDVVSPEHHAGPTWYDIEDAWITRFFLELRRTKRTIRAQVHTHPGAGVRHSPTDDSFPIAPSAGFVSMVLPHYAMGPVDVTDSYVAVQAPEGSWAEVLPTDAITWR